MRKPPGQSARSTVAAVAAVIALGTAGCAAAAQAAQPPQSRGTARALPAADPRPYGAADTAFGLAALGAWCRADPQSNLVFSPASLATGLGLAYLGARGGTAAAMASVLHLPAAGRALAAGLRARQVALARAGGPGVTVASSNRVWADPSLRPLRSYLNAAATAYQAGLWRVPLLTEPDQARATINAAVGHDTRGHIPDLLPPGALNGDAWVLTDALYLDASWATPFTASRTKPGPFTTASGAAATAHFMHGTGYRTAQAGGWTAVSLPYRGGKLAMTALLPPAGRGSGGCQAPSTGQLGALNAALDGTPRAASSSFTGAALPTVNLSSHQDVSGLLTALGMGVAFGSRADFTGLSPNAAQLTRVEHAATLQVNEKGTVGSAATAVGVAPTAIAVGGAPEVVFDRPYLMLVTDTATGEPLFLARVANPAASPASG